MAELTARVAIKAPDLRRGMATNALLIAFAVLVLFFSLSSDVFFTVGNFRTVLLQSALTLVIVTPFALLLMAGYVDLSVGSTVGLSAVVSGWTMLQGVAWPLAALVGVLTGLVVGLVHSWLVVIRGLSPIIVTLGTLSAVRGLSQIVAPDALYGFPESFLDFGTAGVLGVPILVIIAVVVVTVGVVILNWTATGKHILATGGNPEAARVSGVNITRIGIWLFVMTGAAAGLGGVMLAARVGSTPAATAGLGLEMAVLTAALLGGVAFTGGRGTMRGVVLGVLFLALLQNGLTILNVPPSWSVAAQGTVLVLAAFAEKLAGAQAGKVRSAATPE
ncbi:ABC transporter permease [Blastococcus sp. CT_GayMR20]|uniref:ABC transporter permease n=1 Tax=Blastococcus sp. CT_GayMR20 TaxID=2559609 RepID=UPI001431534C|nr:ABC transporter permease [Blastococcus sp. CT_GayMR20]